MIELITRRFRIEEDDDVFLCEAHIRKMPGYMQLYRTGTKDKEIVAQFWVKVI